MGELNKALYRQGEIDGIKELLVGVNSDLDRYLATLAKDEVNETPAY